MHRVIGAALLASFFVQPPAVGQTVRLAIDCNAQRLNGAQRETCASPDLMRLTAEIHGAITTSCSKTSGPYVAVIFTCMNETRAVWFYDAKKPTSSWEGVVERHGDRLVLAQVQP